MKTGLDGLGETTAGKAVGKAVDEVTPDAVKRGIGNAADYGKRSLDSWAGNDLNRQSYANALWGAAAVVADSRLPGKGRGKGHGRHDLDGHARSHDGHNGGKDGGHAHDRADADGGSRAGTSHRHSRDEAGTGGGTAYGTSRPTFAGGSTGTRGSRPGTHGGGSRREGSHGGHNDGNSGSGQYADGGRLGHDANGHAADGSHAGNGGRPSENRIEKPSYKHGESDGGPGAWGYNHTPAKGAEYQHQVTGAPRHTEYIVKTDLMPSGQKAFDGYDPKRDVLLDAKDWDDWPIDKKFAIDSVLDDAQNSSDVAKQAGRKLEWHVPTEAKKQQLDKIFDKNPDIEITVVVTPKIN